MIAKKIQSNISGMAGLLKNLVLLIRAKPDAVAGEPAPAPARVGSGGRARALLLLGRRFFRGARRRLLRLALDAMLVEQRARPRAAIGALRFDRPFVRRACGAIVAVGE